MQDELPHIPKEEAMFVLEQELVVRPSYVFFNLSSSPVGERYLSKAYKGRTMEGEEVAVKEKFKTYYLMSGLSHRSLVATLNYFFTTLAFFASMLEPSVPSLDIAF